MIPLFLIMLCAGAAFGAVAYDRYVKPVLITRHVTGCSLIWFACPSLFHYGHGDGWCDCHRERARS